VAVTAPLFDLPFLPLTERKFVSTNIDLMSSPVGVTKAKINFNSLVFSSVKSNSNENHFICGYFIAVLFWL
jgi:hypothetical protein